MTTIAVVDYGAGNLTSVVNGLETVGATVRVAATPADLEEADGVLIPGVGHYAQTAALDDAWRQTLRGLHESDVAVLGICLGMQWLFSGSDEAADAPGLGLLPGRVVRLEPVAERIKVPHVGWNSLDPTGRPSQLLHGIGTPVFGYFAHSFAVPPVEDAVALTDHGVSFAAVVESGRVFGIQCHPEKSGPAGLTMLRNFVRVAGKAPRC